MNEDSILSTYHIAKQKPASTSMSDDMKVKLQSYPPLGQVTSLHKDDLVLTAILEVPSHRSEDHWEVALWYMVDESGEWTESILSPSQVDVQPQDLQAVSEHVKRLLFTTSMTLKSGVQFTLKFRAGETEDWRWIRDEQGLDDGFVVKSSPVITSEDLGNLIPDLDNRWNITDCLSQAPRTKLWSLEVMVPAAESEASSNTEINIGTPWGSFMRWFALVRLWTPWIAPRQGKNKFAVDEDAILCSFLNSKGRNLTFLALSGLGNTLSVFRNRGDGSIAAHIRNDGSSEEKAIILVAESEDFDCAVAAASYYARSLIESDRRTNTDWNQELETLTDDIKIEWQENWYDGLGYCTWNALGQKLSEKKIWDAVDTLAQHDINFTSLIIDDNWQSLDYKGEGQFQYGWVDFEAEPSGFPNGLKATISHIREKYPDIQHIAVWHAILGYWGGIAPDGEIAKKYKTIEVMREVGSRRNLPLGGKMTVVAEEDVPRFYDDFYRFLSDAGIDAVKTDAQFMMDTWENPSVRRSLIKTYLDTWTITSLRHFSIKSISCMSQFPEAMFYSQMPQNRPPILIRNSDDFFPEIPASHPWHVWANAHNSVFTKHLNALPDWDMFQTVHDYSGFHAAARCVSGGPIYITDVPGQHNMDLIRQMTGVTPRGKTVIFRPSVVGRSVYPYMGYHDNLLLKVGSYHGSSAGTPILAVFNVSSNPLTELVPLSCFPGTVADTNYVIRAHRTGKVSSPTSIDSERSLITASLDVRGYDIFTAFPLGSFPGVKHGDIWISNLGLLGKMTGCAAIVTNKAMKLENGRIVLETRLKALGVLGVYISSLPDMTVEGDFMVTIQEQPIPASTVRFSSEDSHVLQVDIEKAWKEMKLDSGWSNEVEVKVYFDS